MAIRIVNGKAVVVQDDKDKQTTPSGISIQNGRAVVGTPQIPTPQEESPIKAFTRRDPDIIKEQLIALIPGLSQTIEDAKRMRQEQEARTKPYTRAEIRALQNKPLINVGKGVIEMAKGLPAFFANAITTPAMTASEALGGPSTAKIPIIGDVSSIQEQARQLQGQGAGRITAAAIPTLNVLASFLTGRGAINKARGLRKPTTPETPTQQAIPPETIPSSIEKPAFMRQAEKSGYTPIDTTTGGRIGYGKGVREQPQNMRIPPIEEPLFDLSKLPDDQRLAIEGLRKAREARKQARVPEPEGIPGQPAPAEVLPPSVIDTTPIKGTGPLKTIWNEYTQNVVERVAEQGKPGAELAKRGRAVVAQSHARRGMKAVEIENNFPKLTPEQQAQFFEVVEGRAVPTDPKVAQAALYNKQLATELQSRANQVGVLVDDVTKQPIGDPQTYFPHTLNEAGKQALAKKPNTFFKNLAEFNGITEAEARTMWFRELAPERTVRAGFEKQRQFNLPKEYIEMDPVKAWNSYNSDFWTRISTAEQFGPQYKVAENLASEIGRMGGDEMVARNYIDQIVGRNMKNMPLENAVTNLVQRTVHTKLSFTSSLPNASQGYLANTNMYGNRYATYGMLKAFTKEGRQFAKETGVIGKGFYSDFSTQNKLWGRLSGFPITEDFNFVQVANATRRYAQDMYKRLEKNPNDTLAQQKLSSMGIDWKKNIESGIQELSKEDLAVAATNQSIRSIFPKVAGGTPAWSQSGIGRMTYLFWHYQLQNPKFLLSEFEFGKGRGLKQLAKTTGAAVVLGEPIADLLAFVKGEERPDDALMRMADNYLTVVGGAPFQALKLGSKFGGFGPSALPTLGGPPVSSAYQSGAKVVQDIKKGNQKKALEDIFRAWLRGDIPVGPYVPSGSLFERTIPPITGKSN